VDETPHWRPGYGQHFDRGLARVSWAATGMGITHDRLVQEAREGGISTDGGIELSELVRLMPKLIVSEHDPERKARLRAAMQTFIAARDHDRDADADR
jgi:hypothetical protein